MTTQTIREKQTSDTTIIRLVFAGVMAAIVCVVTYFRFPLGESQVHFANSMCLLSGLLLGPVWGGAAAGLGSALYDMIGPYGFVEAMITFVNKFAMAWVAGKLFRTWMNRRGKQEVSWKETVLPAVIACAAGALTYVALYLIKSYLQITFVNPIPRETVPTVMFGKLFPSLINAAFAVATAPVFYHAIQPALKSMGVLKKL